MIRLDERKDKSSNGGNGTIGLLLPFRPRRHRACRTKRFRALRLKLRFCHPPEAQACAIGRMVGDAGGSRLCKGLIPQWNLRSSLQAPPRPLGQSVILRLVVASANFIFSVKQSENGWWLPGLQRALQHWKTCADRGRRYETRAQGRTRPAWYSLWSKASKVATMAKQSLFAATRKSL